MREWSISAFFPEVKPAHQAHHSCMVKADSLSEAALVGLDIIRDNESLRGKHIGIARVTIVAAGRAREEADLAPPPKRPSGDSKPPQRRRLRSAA